MCKRQFVLCAEFLKEHMRSGPLGVVTAILGCLSVMYAILGSVSPEFGYFEEDHEEENLGRIIKKSEGSFRQRFSLGL